MARSRGRPRDNRPRNGDGHRNGGYHDQRPRGPSPPRYPPPPTGSYDRGRHDSDSWRPGDNRSLYDAQSRSHYPSTDSYRPGPPQGDFTFRVDKPAGVGESGPDHRGHNSYRGRRDGRRGGAPRKPRWQPPHPSERALISGLTHTLPEKRLADEGAAKFRDLDALSDDDEKDMEISSHSSQSDSESDSEGPSKKRARTTVDDAPAADAAPKWSNPDPYTALPCPDETTRKKRDVVKLIRKARVEEAKKPAAATEAENFISFDFSSDEEDGDNKPQTSENPQRSQPSQPQRIQPPRPPSLPPIPPPPLPPGPPPDTAPVPTGPLGSRKRTVDDVIKPPDYGQLKKPKMKPVKGATVAAWMPKANEEPCPWAVVDHTATKDMAFRLHKEIVDFYEFVRPRQFEQRIRDNLVENLRKAMKRDGRNFASAQVYPFGSFMSGLYLPTADMDLVVCSQSFLRRGPPTYLGARSWLYKFQKFLVMQGVAEQNSIEVIAHARIPLVKFVDKLTGLKVDVSFENLGGVTAIETFMRWKERYPAMPTLVTVIKHFLLMRGLNEPVNGGIGGFSVICLVVSMLQMMPQVQSRNLIPEHHLGEMLLEFFELYGRRFNYQRNAISLTQPYGYIRKNDVTSFTYKNQDRLSIIDPNNSANDIAGGSSNTPAILARFHDAYDMLVTRMRDMSQDPHQGGILDVIFQGDYSSFRMQRDYLRHVHEKTIGPCVD
ncbi:hypothetical protein B0I35DRAFT_397716 [Stachybotrys elegans]|uniref:polynucleotide adenylyltransferase n=1 Tax=Stachybotrys elegans TaxID=80388 RepID=A0A8K0WMJ9_9HYPO|nr:hypothetical protein B0I35DRAFT_397716 [Stachybotrys elegans]